LYSNLLNLTDTVKEKEWKTILQHISGTFEPGTLTAIMGSSGAGKTTVLNVLAGRLKGKKEGTVLLNGIPMESAPPVIRKQIAYVMQDDLLLSTQTPREIIKFSALLRIPNTYSKEEKQQRVDSIIAQV
jgi:ATP-binding cassette subfamily G (WHITE) protein 2 (PDR)